MGFRAIVCQQNNDPAANGPGLAPNNNSHRAENDTVWRFGPSPLAPHRPTALALLPNHSAPAALATTLLRDWEAAARPAPTPAYQAARPGLLARLTQFVALLLRPDDVNIDPADARTVLAHATAFRLGHATAAGPGRAGRIAPLLAADLTLFPPDAPPAGLRPVAALLSLQSGTEHDLEMDELTEIVEAIQRNLLSPNTEMVFGHGIAPEAETAGLRAWLLVGYGNIAEATTLAFSTTRNF